MKKLKYIKINKANLLPILTDFVLKETNAVFISSGVHRLCRKFIRDLKKIPLSAELQNLPKNWGKIKVKGTLVKF